jgi:hypothetical protein
MFDMRIFGCVLSLPKNSLKVRKQHLIMYGKPPIFMGGKLTHYNLFNTFPHENSKLLAQYIHFVCLLIHSITFKFKEFNGQCAVSKLMTCALRCGENNENEFDISVFVGKPVNIYTKTSPLIKIRKKIFLPMRK